MNEGISINEACETGALTPEDYARSCNQDGSVKQNNGSTTFYIKGNESQPIQVDNTLLAVGAIGLAVAAILVIALIAKLVIRRRT